MLPEAFTPLTEPRSSMFRALVSPHLAQIQPLLAPHTVVVYQGFPYPFMEMVMASIPLLGGQPYDGARIDLAQIEAETADLAARCAATPDAPASLLYEQFYALTRHTDLTQCPRRFLLVRNALFISYPNFSTETSVDIEHCIETETPFEENALFNRFYVNPRIVEDLHLQQYPRVNDAVAALVQEHLLLPPGWTDQISLQDMDPAHLPEHVQLFPSPDASYDQFKVSLLDEAQAPQHPIHLLVDPSALVRDPRRTMDELALLAYIFAQNGREIFFHRKIDQHREHFRDDFRALLQQYWGSDTFRELRFYANPDRDREKIALSQGTVIESLVQQAEQAMAGKPYTDVFLTAPTGAGKSVLFQIPALYLSQRYQSVTLVVSPLKALMYDQVTALRERGVQEVAFINSDISLAEREAILHQIHRGDISIVYLSPELLLAHPVTHFVGKRPLGLLVVDEAHLVTTWGRDFRVDYWYLGHYLRKLRTFSENRFPIVALTATAAYGGKQDLVFDTVSSLNMRIAKLFIGNVRRDEITYDISPFSFEDNHEAAKLQSTLEEVRRSLAEGIKTIVYFPWTNQIVKLFEQLTPDERNLTGKYYGNVSQTERTRVAESFKAGKLLVILATKAFGMGVDIQDIQRIFHHAPSGNLADYVQEVGRVARIPGMTGIASVHFNSKDLKFTRILNALSAIRQYQVRLMLHKLYTLQHLRNTKNLLLSVEDFTYLFPRSDIDQKVKSALLLLEKDLEQRYGYPVILVRPKALSAQVYAKVQAEGEAAFLATYSAYAEKVATAEAPKAMKMPVLPPGYSIKPIVKQKSSGEGGSIYRLRLDHIWENYFDSESYPIIQQKFFDKSLFGELNEYIYPQLQLTIHLTGTRDSLQGQVKELFDKVEAAILSFGLQTYFSRNQLEEALAERIADESLRRRIVALLVTLYAAPPQNFGTTGGRKQPETDTFLVLKKYQQGGDQQMRFDDRAYRKSMEAMEKKWSQLFEKADATHYTGYVTADSEKNKRTLKLAYLLETLQIGTYQLAGGKHAQIYIRINDPGLLATLSGEAYENTEIEALRHKQEEALTLLDHFFTTQMNDARRWDYVEDYFLGRDPSDGAIAQAIASAEEDAEPEEEEELVV
ncbi:MAG: hypothetical protein OHK0039_03750 [Bacteroidia bacterium]